MRARMTNNTQPKAAHVADVAPGFDLILGMILGLFIGLVSAQGAMAQGMPGGGPSQVGVVTATLSAVPFYQTLPGRAVALQEANIRPTVEGIIDEIAYEAGKSVKTGDLLFRLRQDRYAAAAVAAEAEKAGAEAALSAAQSTVARYRKLVGQGVSQADLDTAEANLLAAQATLSAAKSDLTLAQIDLDGTEIRSPIDGIPALPDISVGAVVTANQTTALTTVRRVDPIYVDMAESSARILRNRNRVASGELVRSDDVAITLTLEDGSQYDSLGTFVSPDTQVSATTGTVSLRIQFDNPDRLIMPGQFLRVNVKLGSTQAILVPQRATRRGSDGSLTAFKVQDGKAMQITLTETGSYQNAWIVTDGITAGDQIIVDGLKSLTDGAQVTPQPVEITAEGLVEDVTAAPAADTTVTQP